MQRNISALPLLLCLLLAVVMFCSSACAESAADYPVGSVIEFGHYEQDSNSQNGAEPIEWFVLSNEGNELLLLSKLGLAPKAYDVSTTRGVIWKNSTLRAWLNDQFLRAAFSKEEQEKLVVSQIETIQFSEKESVLTEDKVFLLTDSEARKLSKTMLIAESSKSYEKILDNPCFWWLRSGVNVNMNGDLCAFSEGQDVSFYTRQNLCPVAIRPCIRIRLTAAISVCPSCNWETDMADAKFCIKCGTAFDQTKVCSTCSWKTDMANAQFCIKCGTKFQ